MKIKQTNNESEMTIFNQRLAGYLMFKGFKLLGLGDNYKLQGKNVFFFTRSNELNKAINEYFGKK